MNSDDYVLVAVSKSKYRLAHAGGNRPIEYLSVTYSYFSAFPTTGAATGKPANDLCINVHSLSTADSFTSRLNPASTGKSLNLCDTCSQSLKIR
jgi:hypothetical protein